MSDRVEFNILRFNKLPSTNNHLKALNHEKNLEEYSVVITNEQTAGKGQAGNSWESEVCKNLTFSLLLKPEYIEIQDQFIISKAVVLGITEVFKSYASGFSVKWPNDIYFNDKKIGGILIENSLSQNTISESVVGIGLNINQETFISDAPNPISLSQICRRQFDLEQILRQVLESIVNHIRQIQNKNIQQLNASYLESLYRKEGYHPYKDKDGEFNAKIIGINPYGHLELLTKEGKQQNYAFKEVEFIHHKQ